MWKQNSIKPPSSISSLEPSVKVWNLSRTLYRLIIIPPEWFWANITKKLDQTPMWGSSRSSHDPSYAHHSWVVDRLMHVDTVLIFKYQNCSRVKVSVRMMALLVATVCLSCRWCWCCCCCFIVYAGVMVVFLLLLLLQLLLLKIYCVVVLLWLLWFVGGCCCGLLLMLLLWLFWLLLLLLSLSLSLLLLLLLVFVVANCCWY